MNLMRINELGNLLSRLYKNLKDLGERKDSLRNEHPNASAAQQHLDAAVAAAQNRVSSLSAFGFRSDFLESIYQPVQKRPDFSSIAATVSNEITKTEEEIAETYKQISRADQEKKQLEMEAV